MFDCWKTAKVNISDFNYFLINNPNDDKNPETWNVTKEITIKTDTDTIYPKEKFVVLGWTLNRRFDYTDHLNTISQKVHYRMHRASELKKYMSESVRIQFAT